MTKKKKRKSAYDMIYPKLRPGVHGKVIVTGEAKGIVEGDSFQKLWKHQQIEQGDTVRYLGKTYLVISYDFYQNDWYKAVLHADCGKILELTVYKTVLKIVKKGKI